MSALRKDTCDASWPAMPFRSSDYAAGRSASGVPKLTHGSNVNRGDRGGSAAERRMPMRAPTLKKLENGKWQVRWEEESGRQRAKNFFSKELAQEFLRALHRGDADERARVTGKTFGDILEQWRRDRYGS